MNELSFLIYKVETLISTSFTFLFYFRVMLVGPCWVSQFEFFFEVFKASSLIMARSFINSLAKSTEKRNINFLYTTVIALPQLPLYLSR